MSKDTPTAHVLVPKHSKVGEREKKELFKKHAITIEQLPKILKVDPALAGLEIETGDLIKIERNSPTAGIAVYYRVVADE